MRQTHETRPLGAGLGEASFPGGIDNRRYPTKNTAVQEQSKARLNYLARGIHLLGPAALGYGLDMTRSLREELSLYVRHPVEVRRLALNLEQVRALNLPPNPAKESDARFAQYVEETGAAECWELDALSPTIIDTLLDRAIRELVDRPAWRRALAQEEDPARLASIADDFGAILRGWPPCRNFHNRAASRLGNRSHRARRGNVTSIALLTSTFAFGRASGVVEGVLAACGVAASHISPVARKRAVGLSLASKSASRAEAIRRWPDRAALFARVKDDGSAEAALIGVAMRKGGAR